MIRVECGLEIFWSLWASASQPWQRPVRPV